MQRLNSSTAQQLNSSTAQQLNSSTAQQLNSSTAQQLNSSTAQQLNSSTAQQLNSSTAQQLNSSTAQQLILRCAVLYGGLILLLVQGGCGGSAAATTATGPSSNNVMHRPRVVEAGVVLADQAGYLCLPLEQIGLAATSEIQLVTSSCDCIQPSVVNYLSTTGYPSPAILLTYQSDPSETANHGQAASLGVIVDLQTADGATHQFTVNLVHSALLTESVP